MTQFLSTAYLYIYTGFKAFLASSWAPVLMSIGSLAIGWSIFKYWSSRSAQRSMSVAAKQNTAEQKKVVPVAESEQVVAKSVEPGKPAADNVVQDSRAVPESQAQTNESSVKTEDTQSLCTDNDNSQLGVSLKSGTYGAQLIQKYFPDSVKKPVSLQFGSLSKGGSYGDQLIQKYLSSVKKPVTLKLNGSLKGESFGFQLIQEFLTDQVKKPVSLEASIQKGLQGLLNNHTGRVSQATDIHSLLKIVDSGSLQPKNSGLLALPSSLLVSAPVTPVPTPALPASNQVGMNPHLDLAFTLPTETDESSQDTSLIN